MGRKGGYRSRFCIEIRIHRSKMMRLWLQLQLQLRDFVLQRRTTMQNEVNFTWNYPHIEYFLRCS
jgi:hypothetical protein